jgi:hypothetical protein
MADNLGEFLAQQDWELLRTIKGWHVERDAVSTDVVRLTLPARDGERFILRCICDGYPDKAPSVAFINAAGSTADRTAWPAGTATFYLVVKLPTESFLCTDLTREGFQHHQEWTARPNAWKGSTHTLLDLFNYVHELLNSTDYEGRTKQ